MNPYWLILHGFVGLISWVLYAIVTKYIYSHKKHFNEAFSRVWTIFAVVNFLQYITMKLYYQIPLHIPGNSSIAGVLVDFPVPHFQPILYLLSHYFIYCQKLCVLLIISISFRLIVFPFSSSPIWERYLSIAVGIIFITPIPFIINVLFINPRFTYMPVVDGFLLFPSIRHNQTSEAIRNILQLNIFEIVISVLSGFLKVVSIICLSANKVRRRDDRNLYVVTSVIFILSLLKFICAIVMIFSYNAFIKKLALIMYPITADCLALSSPYALLYINSRIRNNILECKLFHSLLGEEATKASFV